MNYILNKMVKNLRLELGLTQQQLADMVNCSPQQISKIERYEREITYDLLTQLSFALNTDLLHFKNNISKFNTTEDYMLFNHLRGLIDNEKIEDLEKMLLNNELLDNFTYGEPLLLKNYIEALVLSLKYKKFDKSTDLCLKSINCTKKELSVAVTKVIKPVTFYSTVIMITYNLCSLHKYDLVTTICKNYLDHFDKIMTSDAFTFTRQDYYYKKAYLMLLNNYVFALYELKDYENALIMCNMAIVKCNDLNILKSLTQLLKMKIEILYRLNSIEEAKEIYVEFKIICKLTDSIEYFDKVSNTFQTTYKELFIV